MFVFDLARVLLLSLVIHSCFGLEEEKIGHILKQFCSTFAGYATYAGTIRYHEIGNVYLYEISSIKPNYTTAPVRMKQHLFSLKLRGYGQQYFFASVRPVDDDWWINPDVDLDAVLKEANEVTKETITTYRENLKKFCELDDILLLTHNKNSFNLSYSMTLKLDKQTSKSSLHLGLLGTKPFGYFHSLYVAPEDYKNWSRQKLIKKLKFLSDVFFNVPVANGVLARRAGGWDIYAYYLDHYNDAIWDGKVPKKLRGAPHFAEFPYANGVGRLAKYDFTKKEQVVADVFRQSFASFVKNGAPTNNHEVWLDTGTEDFLRYLRITPDPEMRDGFHNDSLTFWHSTRKLGFDVTSLQPVKKPEETKETKQEL